MRIESQRLIFIHVPKNAGQSIEALFGRRWLPKRPADAPVEEPWPERHKRHTALRRYEQEPDFARYYRFAIVRNPWDRMVSCYVYELSRAKAGIGLHCSNRQLLAKNLPFLDYIKQADFDTTFLRTQSFWLQNKAGKIGINQLLRFENLADDFRSFALARQLPICELPHVNQGERTHYSAYYNDEAVALIAQKYQEDIRNFGYSFEPRPKAS